MLTIVGGTSTSGYASESAWQASCCAAGTTVSSVPTGGEGSRGGGAGGGGISDASVVQFADVDGSEPALSVVASMVGVAACSVVGYVGLLAGSAASADCSPL